MSLIAATMLILLAPLAVAEEPREVEWKELMPMGWKPKMPDFSSFFHDPTTPAAAQDEDAPVVEALDDTLVSIKGWLVPLEWGMDALKEFLFVPWFGACIHVPPPPPNQIIRVTLEKGVPEREMFEPQQLTGRLRTERSESELALAGYRMEGALTRRLD
ncbi:MAG: DUF3299 domain-containing protein [Gammaproteobacteria bacterium]|nr:DUF3299 domain-containing protein [Gammaproteobacteria bacterium]